MKFSHDVDYAREAAQKAKRFYSADAIGRLDIQIANVQERDAMAKMYQLGVEYLRMVRAS